MNYVEFYQNDICVCKYLANNFILNAKNDIFLEN